MKKRKRRKGAHLTAEEHLQFCRLATAGVPAAALAEHFRITVQRAVVTMKREGLAPNATAEERADAIVQQICQWTGRKIVERFPEIILTVMQRMPWTASASLEDREKLHCNIAAALQRKFPQPEAAHQWLN